MKQEILQEQQLVFDGLYNSVIRNDKLMFAGRLLQRAALEHGDTIALIYQDKNITYKKLYALGICSQ